MNRLLFLSVLILASCARPAMENGRPPEIVLNFQDASPTTSVSSADGTLDAGDNCVNMRRAGAVQRVMVSASDNGGLRQLGLSAAGGRITVVSHAPSSATVRVFDTRLGQRLLVTYPDAPDGEVYVSSLINIRIQPTANVVSVRSDGSDRAGNAAGTDQFDLREPTDPVVCRGE